MASTHQLKRLAQTQSITTMLHLAWLSDPAQPNEPSSLPLEALPSPEITTLLLRFDQLFQEPTILPPPRTIAHHIHLLPQINPVNVHPYRYPHFQKSELEKQVATMLDAGFIQLSNIPFSSPVLLVKKKDGSWRFCVDY